MRSEIRKIVLDLLGFLSQPAPGVHILNGHRLVDQTDGKNIFSDVLKHLSGCAKLINADEAVALIESKCHVKEPMIAFTFDDGFLECYTHFAPALEEYGIRGIFFVNPNFADGDDAYIEHFNQNCVHTKGKLPMRWNQIIDLRKRGHVIGSHTMDHMMVIGDNKDELFHQIVDCKLSIENQLGEECNYFAFPYGRLDHVSKQAIDIACSNYKYVFSQSNYKHYFSFDGRVINRRHFEPFWPLRHIDYFLSCKKK